MLNYKIYNIVLSNTKGQYSKYAIVCDLMDLIKSMPYWFLDAQKGLHRDSHGILIDERSWEDLEQSVKSRETSYQSVFFGKEWESTQKSVKKKIKDYLKLMVSNL